MRLAYMTTPLSLRAGNGYEGVVKLLQYLREKRLTPRFQTKKGRTLLLLAVEIGEEGAVKLLLGREIVNPDMQDDDGRILPHGR